MTNVRIHRSENLLYPRYHNTWFAYFVEYCRRFFNVEYINYWTTIEDHVAYKIKIKLQKPLGQFGTEFSLTDVDMVIENLDNYEISIVSFTEYFNSIIVHYIRSEYFKSLVLAHFNYHHLYHWLKRDRLVDKIHLVYPGIFPLYLNFDIDYFRAVRDKQMTNDELFFKGSGFSSYRQAVGILGSQSKIDPTYLSFEQYLGSLAQSKIALSYRGQVHEFCYRDMEYMAIGVPFVRIEYCDSVHDGLYPNHHYVSINREIAYQVYHESGDAGVADLLYNKYLEVRDDHDFLKFISKNQRKYYDDYCRLEKSSELIFHKLNLQDWI